MGEVRMSRPMDERYSVFFGDLEGWIGVCVCFETGWRNDYQVP